MNGQPWRFVVYRSRIHIFARENLLSRVAATREMRQIDMGIVLSHLSLSAEELWMDAELTYLDQLAGRSVKGNTYVMSLMFQN